MTTIHMPSVNSREAPRFSDDVTGFDSFFNEVKELAGPTRANLSEADKIRWAIRYAGSEAESWKCLECYGKTTTTFATFRTQVLTCYPQLSADHRYTHNDLNRLLDQFSDLHEMDKGDLGKYLRKFLSITSYLISESRLSDRERDAAFLRGFPQPIRNRILARLAIKKPDVIPGDGYTFMDVQAAALFVLEAGGITPPQANIQAQVPIIKSEPAEQGSIGELIQAMSSLTRVFMANTQSQQYAPCQACPPRPAFPTPGGVSQNPTPWWNSPPCVNPDSFVQNCLFCSSHEHFVRECLTAAQYLQRGQIMYDEHMKLVLPDSRYPPAYLGR